MIFGTTYSHRHSQYLRLNPQVTFAELLDFHFTVIRLACYWDEIETSEGRYDFSAIRGLLDECEKVGQRVLLTVGMKAPRWPEYYFPHWLPDKTPEGAENFVYSFIEQTITTLKEYSCITHWQVENEPLDQSGPKQFMIPISILQREVRIVKTKDKRPILINVWGNELGKRNLLPKVASLSDIIGLDLYYKVPLFARIYRGPHDSDKKLTGLTKTVGKPVWVTELQAEPWEHNTVVARTDKTPSMNERLLKKNYERAKELQPEGIFFWGFEYWLMRKNMGDASLWTAAREIMKSEK